MTPPSDEEAPHIAAIRNSMAAGFRFLHLATPDGTAVAAIHAERRTTETIDSYTIQATTEAIAARFRTEDYPDGNPLWHKHGTVADVVNALLALPRQRDIDPARPSRYAGRTP